MTTNTAESDLRARWRPTHAQIAVAAVAFADPDNTDLEVVYTPHALVNKTPSWWTPEVQVIPLEGVYLDRGELFRSLERQIQAVVVEFKTTACEAYTVHRRDGSWAVFDGPCWKPKTVAERY